MNKMEKAAIASITYEPSDTIEKQGKRRNIENYLKAGYFIKEERNGYWVLVKTAQLNVTLTNTSCTITINMKADVCEYYGRRRISQSLIDKFMKDIQNDKLIIYLDSAGNYSLVKCQ